MFIKRMILGLCNHGMLEFMGDRLIAKLVYHLKTGNSMDWNNPVTFNEKLQWLKVNDHNPEYTKLVDKITAKTIVGDKIGYEHIVPIYGQWQDAKDIPFDALPEKFVLKCNHDQGSVVLVHDKNSINIEEIRKVLSKHLKHSNYYLTREYGYKNIQRYIFAEKYLGGSIKDYKFYCFDGEPLFLYVGQGLTADHSLKIDYFDMNWKPMPFYRTDYERLGAVPKPEKFNEMIDIARKLSSGFPFVRIDLFEERGNVYFSEFSPCPASGYMPFVPKEYDRIVGDWLTLKKYDKKKGKYVDIYEN